MRTIEFRSDNSVGVAAEILDAITAANTGSCMAYGGDSWTEELTDLVREVFEHDTARVFPVVSGTAANALALSAMCPPWGSVICHERAHIFENEGGATSMFGAGAVMRGLPGDDFRLDPAVVEAELAGFGWGDNHHSQPAVVSVTVPSEFGTVSKPDEVAAISAVADRWGLRTHLDGARMANALAALGCTPAELTWRAGVSAFTLGATKNGALSTDAIVSFDDGISGELHYRTKRAGHVASKMRFQSAQLIAYLTDGLWLELAARANAAMARLAGALREMPDFEFVNRPDVNILFLRVAPAVIDRLEAVDLTFYRLGPDTIRLVTSFRTADADVDETIERIRSAVDG